MATRYTDKEAGVVLTLTWDEWRMVEHALERAVEHNYRPMFCPAQFDMDDLLDALSD